MTATELVCGSCDVALRANAKFCNRCGAPITPAATSAEYKQVTVLFADAVHSMDIAAAVGAERLREIMADLADRATERAREIIATEPLASAVRRELLPGPGADVEACIRETAITTRHPACSVAMEVSLTVPSTRCSVSAV